MPTTAKKKATYEDLCALPDNMVGELIDGDLIATPRPTARHGIAASVLGSEILGPFQLGKGGPGGWWIIDEPELGLHPAAENVIGGLMKYASRTKQIILSTQSASFVDQFNPDDVIVAEIDGGESTFRRQSEAELRDWLERYTLSQIWSKNIIGGRP